MAFTVGVCLWLDAIVWMPVFHWLCGLSPLLVMYSFISVCTLGGLNDGLPQRSVGPAGCSCVASWIFDSYNSNLLIFNRFHYISTPAKLFNLGDRF